MTEKFEDSQGFRLVRDYLDDGDPEWTDALRKFFLHEQGIWVDEPTGALVLLNGGVGKPRYVSIFHDGLMYGSHERDNPWISTHQDIADRFFAAHPEPKPLPSEPHTAWVDKYGTDIWWVDGLGVLRCCASPSSNPAKYAPFTQLIKGASHE